MPCRNCTFRAQSQQYIFGLKEELPEEWNRFREIANKKLQVLALNPSLTLGIDLKSNTLGAVYPSYVQLPNTLPPIYKQIFNDCVINSMAAAIEYLTTPTVQDINKLLPLKISRVGLYNIATRFTFYPNITDWIQKFDAINKTDMGLTLSGALIALDKFGAFPENNITLTDSFVVPGWNYTLKNKITPIPQDMFLIAQDTDFDGIAESMQNSLISKGYLIPKQTTTIVNPYVRLARNLLYEPIEPIPSKIYPQEFFDKIKQYITDNKTIIAGIYVTNTFMRSIASSPYILPKTADKILGGHAIFIVGYGQPNPNKPDLYFYIQNSWGVNWGLEGRGYISQSYFIKYFLGAFAVSLPNFFQT